MTTPAKNKPTPAEYEKLGRALESALIDNYINWLGNTKRQIWQSLVRGIFTGLGTVIGATVVVALIVWVLHLFGVPVIGHLLQNGSSTIKK
jgi:hypothetical protein